MAKNTPRKLSDDQIEQVCQYLYEGHSLQEASEWCLYKWAIQIHKSTLSRYPEVQLCTNTKQKVTNLETQDVLQSIRPNIIQEVLERRSQLVSKRTSYETQLARYQPEDRPFATLNAVIKDIDNTINALTKQLNDMYRASADQSTDLGANNQNSEALADRIKRFETLLSMATQAAPTAPSINAAPESTDLPN